MAGHTHTPSHLAEKGRELTTAAAFSRTRVVIRFESEHAGRCRRFTNTRTSSPRIRFVCSRIACAVDAKCALVCDAILNVFPDFLVTVSRIIMKFVYFQLRTKVAYKSGRVARVPVARRRYTEVDDETRRRSVPTDRAVQQSRETNFRLISHDP